MSFNLHPDKWIQELIFDRKVNKEYHPTLFFNNNNVSEANSQKQLGVVLNNSLSFKEHLKMISSKVNKTIELQRKLHNTLPRSAPLIICKTFVRSHLDYGDIIYSQAYNTIFQQKLELMQYNACLAITEAIKFSSKKETF